MKMDMNTRREESVTATLGTVFYSLSPHPLGSTIHDSKSTHYYKQKFFDFKIQVNTFKDSFILGRKGTRKWGLYFSWPYSDCDFEIIPIIE